MNRAITFGSLFIYFGGQVEKKIDYLLSKIIDILFG